LGEKEKELIVDLIVVCDSTFADNTFHQFLPHKKIHPMDMDDSITSRRAFITGGLTGAACASCSCGKNHSHEEVEPKPSGEKVKLLSVDGQVIEVDKAFLKPVPDLPRVSNEEERRGIAGKKFVMVIDLARCKNVGACRDSCNHAHHLHPDHNWVKIYQMQDADHTAPYGNPQLACTVMNLLA
jgi:molybdopterin-containing oxidoreductase family iron-sulfur binding subunit